MFPRVNYAPPPNVVLDLMSALFLFGLNVDATREGKGWHVVKLEDDINRVILFCRHVLIPSLKQTEAKKELHLFPGARDHLGGERKAL